MAALAAGGVAALEACDGGLGGPRRCDMASARRTGGAVEAGRKLEMVMEMQNFRILGSWPRPID